MDYRVILFTHKGVEREKCQDICQYKNLSNATIISLADGVSSKKKSAMGASIVQENIGWMLENEKSINMLDEENLKIKIARTIYETISTLAQWNECEESAFASTLMMAIFPENEEFYWIVHIGDGIVGIVGEGEVNVLSAPQNGITKQYTYTTTSGNLLKRIRIKKCNRRGIVFMMTDGITNEIFKNEESRKRYVELIKNMDWLTMERQLIESGTEDDIGFCCINF